MNVLDKVRARFQEIVARRSEPLVVTKEGILAEAVALAGELAVVLQSTTLDGPAKKAAALELIGEFLDVALPKINYPYVPESIEQMVIDPAVKAGLLWALGPVIDGIVSFLAANALASFGASGTGSADSSSSE